MKKIFLPIVLCVLMAISSLLLACTPIGEHEHNLVPVDEVAATCVKDGIRAHNICTICGYWFDDNGNRIDELDCVIEATGEHTYKDGKCTVCGTPDPTWQGGGGEDPDNPDNPDEPDEPVDQLAWLKGEWTQEGDSPWTVTFDGTTLKISYYRNEELIEVTALSFKAEGDDKVTFVVPNGTQGEYSITKFDEMMITLNFGIGNTENLTKQGTQPTPTGEYARGMKQLVNAGFKLTRYQNPSGMYFDFASNKVKVGSQVEIKYTYRDYSISDEGQLVKIDGVYDIDYASNADPKNPTATWYIYIKGLAINRISWSGFGYRTGNYDWMGTDGRSGTAWIMPGNKNIEYNNDLNLLMVGSDGEFSFPEKAKSITGVWNYTGFSVKDRVDIEITVDAEKNIFTYTSTTTYGDGGRRPSTISQVGSFDDCLTQMQGLGYYYFLHYTATDGSGTWIRYNAYNDKLIFSPTANEYQVFTQQDPNTAIPFAGALPADLKGEYKSAKGTYVFNGRYVDYTPASGEKVNYTVTDVKDGESETTKKITLAVSSDKNTTFELTYDLVNNTLTYGADVYVGENLYLTGATNLPKGLAGTYMYSGTDASDWRYSFDGYKVTSREASGQTVTYYVTEYKEDTKTLTLTEVTDIKTGHKVNDGSEPKTMTFIYSDTENTLTINGDGSNPNRVFKPSEIDIDVVLPDNITGTYYVGSSKTNYIDIFNYNVVLSGFADSKLNGEFTIVGNVDEAIKLSAKDKSANGEEPITVTLKDNTITYNTTVFTKGRPIKFSGDFYNLTAKYTVNDDTITKVDLSGKVTTYTINTEKEEEMINTDLTENSVVKGRYGWYLTAKENGGTGSIYMWYDYIEDACTTNSYSGFSDQSYYRKPASSTVGVPAESAGTYIIMSKSGKSYKATKLIIELTEVDSHAEGTVICVGERYFITGWDGQNKRIITVSPSGKEYRFGFDVETAPDEVTDIGHGNRIFTKELATKDLPTKLQTECSFFCAIETITFDPTNLIVKITPAKGAKKDSWGNIQSPDPVEYYIAKINEGMLTLKPLLSGTERTLYYDEESDNIKLGKDEAVYATHPCEKATNVSMLRGTFKKGAATLTFDGTAEVMVKDGNSYYQYIVKTFDRDAGKITLFAGGAEEEIVYTYDSAKSTLTAGEDVYTIDDLPAGLDGTYKATGKNYEFVIYMGCLVLSGTNYDDTYMIAYEYGSKTVIVAAPDDSRNNSNIYLTIGNGQLVTTTYGVDGTYVFTEGPGTGPQPEAEIILPEGLVGKYLDEKNKENYVYIWENKSVSVYIDSQAGSYTVTKVEGNKVTLSNGEIIEYNAAEFSITYGGNTYILAAKYPLTLPTGLVGKYLDLNWKVNYIEVKADKSVSVYNYDNRSTKKYTIADVEDNKVILNTLEFFEYNAAEFSITFNGNTYILETEYPDKEISLPDKFRGVYYLKDQILTFDDTTEIEVKNADGTQEKWTIIECKFERNEYTDAIIFADLLIEKSDGSTISYEMSASQIWTMVGKYKEGNRKPANVVTTHPMRGVYKNNNKTYTFYEDGFVVYFDGSGYTQYFVVEYTETDDNESTVKLYRCQDFETMNCFKYDVTNDTFVTIDYKYDRETGTNVVVATHDFNHVDGTNSVSGVAATSNGASAFIAAAYCSDSVIDGKRNGFLSTFEWRKRM